MKVCPVCKGWAFDDQEVCYGCMHRFETGSVARDRIALCVADVSEAKGIEFELPIDVFGTWERFLEQVTQSKRYAEAWVWSCNFAEPINLAARLKSLKPDLHVVLVEADPTGSLFVRAHSAGIDEVGSFRELCQRVEARFIASSEKSANGVAVTVRKTLSREIEVEIGEDVDRDDPVALRNAVFDEVAEVWQDVDFGEGTYFQIEALDPAGANHDRVIYEGVE